MGAAPARDRRVISMEPPIGFIILEKAVNLVGHHMIGSAWRPLCCAEWRRYLIFNPDADADRDVHQRVMTVIAEGCEAGEIAAGYRNSNGAADDLDRSAWRMPHWRNYFASGMIDLVLPLLDERGRPNSHGHTARGTCEIFVRRDSLERFILNIVPDVPSGCDGIAPTRPSRGPKAGISIRVEEEMRRDLAAGSTTAEALRSEPEKTLQVRYRASRDTVRKVRNIVLVETRSKPKIK